MQVKLFKKLTALTLAEILISLTILATITILTLPTLKNDFDKTKVESLFKKAYFQLNQALDVEISTRDNFAISTYNETAWNRIKSRLNIVRTCESYETGKCIGSSYKTLDGNTASIELSSTDLLTDGISLKLLSCEGHKCTVMVDINGSKGPNVFGYDAYKFELSNDGVEPIEDAKNIVDNDWKINYW